MIVCIICSLLNINSNAPIVSSILYDNVRSFLKREVEHKNKEIYKWKNENIIKFLVTKEIKKSAFTELVRKAFVNHVTVVRN